MNNIAKTYTATIMIAGDYPKAVDVCRRFCMDVGFCVTVTRTEFVYTGGAEAGVMVGCINYPRFPQSPDQIMAMAIDLANALKREMFQHSYSIVASDTTIWHTDREQ